MSVTVSAQGQVHPDSIRVDPRLLEMVVITATRTPKLISEAPVVTRVITEHDIERLDATTVQDLLQAELPGIEFTYSMNQQVNLNMQGFGGNSVLFLVDGERLAGETLDNVDYSRLGLDGVGRIEVVKGAASSLYGSNAVGGVVNIISRTSTEPWTLNVGTRWGSFGDRRHTAALSLNAGRMNSQTNLQLTHSDPIHLSDSGDLHTIYGSRTVSAKERLVFRATDRLKLTARAGYFFRERESSSVSYDRYRDFAGGLKADYSFSENSDLMVSYAFDQYDKSDLALDSRLDVRDYSNVQHTVRSLYTLGGLTPFPSPVGEGRLTVGGDVMRDYLMTYQFADGGDHTQYTADAFAQWDWDITPSLNMVAAMRYDYYSEARASHLSPKLNLMYKFPKVSLRGGYARGFRAPTLKEMYMQFDMANVFWIYGNPDLQPEVSDNFNASVEWSRSRFNATLMGFYNHVRNRITTLWNQELGGMFYSNMAPVSIAGVDMGISARWDNGLGVRMAYIFTHESLDEEGLRSSTTRPHTATFRLDYNRTWGWGESSLALNGRVLSAVTCDEYTSLTDLSQVEERTYPAYTLWRLTLCHRFKRGVMLTATVDNLFDYRPDYYYSNSPATPGRTYALGLSLDIDNWFNN